MAHSTMPLEVKLTEEELLAKGILLAETTQEIEDLENKKKIIAAEYKTHIDTKSIEAREISTIIKQGFEIRPVEVVERKYYDDQRVVTIRIDTGETVTPRAMTPAERQEPLPFDDSYEVIGDPEQEELSFKVLHREE
jgi:hypothetical protein